MIFGEKENKLTTTEETLVVNHKIASSIDRLHTTMENLATSIDTQINRVEVGIYIILIYLSSCTKKVTHLQISQQKSLLFIGSNSVTKREKGKH